jgi:hypothetical protein
MLPRRAGFQDDIVREPIVNVKVKKSACRRR